MRPAKAAAGMALGALLVGLCGCSDLDLNVGDGSGPTGIRVSYAGLTDGYQTFECAAIQLAATATFEGSGTVEGDVTSRVVWTSSNPGVIDVSNGEIEAEEGSGTTFPAGTVIARSAGTAVIRADYIGFSASFGVTAKPIAALEITPALSRMTPGSTQAFKLEVVFEDGDVALDLSESAVWTLPTADAPASLQSPSTVVALSDPLDRPFLLEARLFTCDRQAERSLSLAAPRELQLVHEQAVDVPLPLGVSDEIRIEAAFDDPLAEPQDLSEQIEIEQMLGDADDASVAIDGTITLRGLVADREVQYRIEYPPLELQALTPVYRFIDSELLSLRVSPERSELIYPQTLQLEALGLFDDGIERTVSREVTWESLNPDLLGVTTTGTDAGEVSGLGLAGDATVQVGASNSEGAVTAEGDVRVVVEE